MRILNVLVWFGALVGSGLGWYQFTEAMIEAQSAPQQAAGAAMALFWVVAPYVGARAIEKITTYGAGRESRS